jgi:hypothetical protein
MKSPSPRRGWALQHWAIDPAKLVSPAKKDDIKTMLQAYQEQELQKYLKRQQPEPETQEKESAVFKSLKLITDAANRPLPKKRRKLLKYPTATPKKSPSILDDEPADAAAPDR